MFTEFMKLAPVGPKPEVSKTLVSLMQRYAEPQRRYHTWQHIEYGLAAYASLFDKPLTPVQFMAWLYHDAVYNPREHDNEERSGVVFMHDNRVLGFDTEKADEINELILSTIPSRPGVSVLNDMDLCILGAEPKTYFEYVKNVRAEYKFASDDLWKNGRAAVLKEFLKRPTLYITREFSGKFTHQARLNMQAELDSLVPQQ